MGQETMKDMSNKTERTYDNTEIDPYLCTCGPCKTFWKKSFGGNKGEEVLKRSVLRRAQDTSTLFKPEQKEWRIKVGDRVTVTGEYTGVVKYVGLIDENLISPEVWVGVHLDDNIGSVHNGVYNGKRYFHCPRGHGAFVKYCDVFPLYPPVDRPPVTGNYMFPSWEQVKQQRSKRRASLSDTWSSSGSSGAGSPRPQANTASGRLTGLTRPKQQTVRVIYDVNDMAYRDQERKEQCRERSMERKREKLNTPKITPQEKKFMKWKDEFGADDRADQMVQTLRKLHMAFETGLGMKERGEIKDDEDTKQTKE